MNDTGIWSFWHETVSRLLCFRWLEFGPGESEKTIEVVIYDDPDFEEDEEFVVKLFDIQETLSDTVPKNYMASFLDPSIDSKQI